MKSKNSLAARARRNRMLPVGTVCRYDIDGAEGTARVVGYTQDVAAARQEGDMQRYITYKLKGLSGVTEDGKPSKGETLIACYFEVKRMGR